MSAGALTEAYAGDPRLPPLRADGRTALAEALYGSMPEVYPVEVATVSALAGAERIVLNFKGLQIDAALWRPATPGPAPLIVGLDFVGPAGILFDEAFPLDPRARAYSRPDYGAQGGRLEPCLRGTSASRWPAPWLAARGYAVLVSCYGSWVPDSADHWRGHGLATMFETGAGAITLWAYALSRLIDAAQQLDGLDLCHVAVAGHSRLGKAALWAAAQDTRIVAVFANQSGSAGAAPARHMRGETLAQLVAAYPHWLRAGAQTDPMALDCDQHDLLAAIAPRAIYLAGAEDDIWADPLGSYIALKAAAPVWRQAEDWPDPATFWNSDRRILNGALGLHIRRGGHDLLPCDWRGFLGFLEALWGTPG